MRLLASPPPALVYLCNFCGYLNVVDIGGFHYCMYRLFLRFLLEELVRDLRSMCVGCIFRIWVLVHLICLCL